MARFSAEEPGRNGAEESLTQCAKPERLTGFNFLMLRSDDRDNENVNARFFKPMLCLAVPKLPEGPDWQYELKLDGYRGIGIRCIGRAHLASRNGKEFSARFATITRALHQLPDETVIDGEIVAVDGSGRPSFNLLQNFEIADAILFYVFDLPILAGTDLRSRPLEQRRALLRELTEKLPDTLRFSESFDVTASDLIDAVRRKASKASWQSAATAPIDRAIAPATG